MDYEKLIGWQDEIRTWASNSRLPDDPYILVALEEAVAAALEGNDGIGAVLVDPQGSIAFRDHNHVLHPYFRSDRHAEMVVLTKFEKQSRGTHTLKGYTLYSSLQPCEMCMIRIITTGISRVYYAGAKEGPFRPPELAPFWQKLASNQEFRQADCSPRLKELGLEIFRETNGHVVKVLMERR